jgi:hypothetical protein
MALLRNIRDRVDRIATEAMFENLEAPTNKAHSGSSQKVSGFDG